MKQVLPVFVALLLLPFVLTSCSDKKKKMKAEVVKECVDGGEKQFSDPKIRGFFHEYCECSGEKIVEKISDEEFKAMKSKSDAETQAKLMPIIQPCLDELQKKMAAVVK